MTKKTLVNITGQPFTVEIVNGKKTKTIFFKAHEEIAVEEKDAMKIVQAFPNIHLKKAKLKK